MSGTDPAGRENEIAASLGKVLSRHGHGFHYAVLQRADQLSNEGKSRWVLEGTEFPVSIHGVVTHIDFVLRSARGKTYLVGECKRADPARAIWCFLKAPYTWRNSFENELIFDQIRFDPSNGCTSGFHSIYRHPGSYHVGVELKTDAPGDGISSRPAVNDAASQVLRGVNGLINHLCQSLEVSFNETEVAHFLPVIFTTAELWVSDAKLSDADLKSGQLSIGSAKKVDWLWFTHNQSPGLQHGVGRSTRPKELSEALRSEYARTIAIVGPDGIDTFLSVDLGL